MWIYKITNDINGKAYVGMTRSENPNDRWKTHKSARSGNGRNAIKQAILKYGVENFTFEAIVKALSEDHLCDLEKELIEQLGTMAPNGYNLTTGGKNGKKSPFAKKSGKKGQIPWNKGLTVADPRVAKYVKTGTKSHLYGKSYRKGIKHTKETRNKISSIQIGKVHSEETKIKMSLAKQGKRHTETARLNMSKSRDHQKVIVRCIQTQQVFESISAASKATGVHAGHISRMVRGLLNSSKGLSFEAVK